MTDTSEALVLPKRPLNSFFLYRLEHNDDEDLKELRVWERSRVLSDRFKELSADEKKVYDDKAAAAKANFETRIAELRRVHGDKAVDAALAQKGKRASQRVVVSDETLTRAAVRASVLATMADLVRRHQGIGAAGLPEGDEHAAALFGACAGCYHHAHGHKQTFAAKAANLARDWAALGEQAEFWRTLAAATHDE